MENKLDVLTKKLYEEGVDKANQEAEKIIAQAKEKAAKLIAEAEEQAKGIKAGAATEVENMKKKAESEMTLSARQAITALKQSITSLISGEEYAQKHQRDGGQRACFVLVKSCHAVEVQQSLAERADQPADKKRHRNCPAQL